VTPAQAKALLAGLIDAGFPATATQSSGAWTVTVTAPAGPIDVALAAGAAVTYGIPGHVPTVTYG
jgi:hypothetical protein